MLKRYTGIEVGRMPQYEGLPRWCRAGDVDDLEAEYSAYKDDCTKTHEADNERCVALEAELAKQKRHRRWALEEAYTYRRSWAETDDRQAELEAELSEVRAKLAEADELLWEIAEDKSMDPSGDAFGLRETWAKADAAAMGTPWNGRPSMPSDQMICEGAAMGCIGTCRDRNPHARDDRCKQRCERKDGIPGSRCVAVDAPYTPTEGEREIEDETARRFPEQAREGEGG